MSVNIAETINNIIGGVIYVVFDYIQSCGAILLSPIRAPLRLWRSVAQPKSNQLAPHASLFFSSVLAACVISIRNFKSPYGEIARLASQSQRFDDVKLLTIAIASILIFVLADLLCRLLCISTSRKRMKRERLKAVTQYQIAAVVAALSLLSLAIWPLCRKLYPARASYAWASWIWNHQWIIELFTTILLAVVVCAIMRKSLLSLGKPRTLLLLAPAVSFGTLFFYTISDAPRAYILRGFEEDISSALSASTTDLYPSITYTNCVITAPETLNVNAVIVNRSKYVTGFATNYAVIGIAQGVSPGYLDQDVAWFGPKASIKLDAQNGEAPYIAILKPGDAVNLAVQFSNHKATTEAIRLIKSWGAEGGSWYDASCFLSLRMLNLEKGGYQAMPNFYTRGDFWAEFSKTASGEIRIDARQPKTGD